MSQREASRKSVKYSTVVGMNGAVRIEIRHTEAEPIAAAIDSILRENARTLDEQIMGPDDENADWGPGVNPPQKDGMHGQSEHHR